MMYMQKNIERKYSIQENGLTQEHWNCVAVLKRKKIIHEIEVVSNESSSSSCFVMYIIVLCSFGTDKNGLKCFSFLKNSCSLSYKIG